MPRSLMRGPDPAPAQPAPARPASDATGWPQMERLACADPDAPGREVTVERLTVERSVWESHAPLLTGRGWQVLASAGRTVEALRLAFGAMPTAR